MNIKRLFIFLFIGYFFSAGVAFSDELVGPKILGLQLGMSKDDVEKITKDINERCGDKENKSKYLRGYKDDRLTLFEVPFALFECKPIYNIDDNFLKSFCEHYKIPNLKRINKYTYEYENKNFKVRISAEMFGNGVTISRVIPNDIKFR